jgi:hypothetical protein
LTAWADVDLKELSGNALKNAVAQIFSDSLAASCSNDTYSGGNLPEVRKVNRDTGHVIGCRNLREARRLAKFNLR